MVLNFSCGLLFLCVCLVFLVCFGGFLEVSFEVFLSALTCFLVAMISLIVFCRVPDAINVCSS